MRLPARFLPARRTDRARASRRPLPGAGSVACGRAGAARRLVRVHPAGRAVAHARPAVVRPWPSCSRPSLGMGANSPPSELTASRMSALAAVAPAGDQRRSRSSTTAAALRSARPTAGRSARTGVLPPDHPQARRAGRRGRVPAAVPRGGARLRRQLAADRLDPSPGDRVLRRAETTYHGLNAFGCCAGPMQFNVTNGPVSTWERYRQAFRAGNRPAALPAPHAPPPVDLRRLRRDHGRRRRCCATPARPGARRRRVVGRLRATTGTTSSASRTPARCSRARRRGSATASARTANRTPRSSTEFDDRLRRGDPRGAARRREAQEARRRRARRATRSGRATQAREAEAARALAERDSRRDDARRRARRAARRPAPAPGDAAGRSGAAAGARPTATHDHHPPAAAARAAGARVHGRPQAARLLAAQAAARGAARAARRAPAGARSG